jgi:hypothetical protein
MTGVPRQRRPRIFDATAACGRRIDCELFRGTVIRSKVAVGDVQEDQAH